MKAMIKSQLTKNFIVYGLLLVAFMVMGGIVSLMYPILGIVSPFTPRNNGLHDHVQHLVSLGMGFGLVVYIVCLSLMAAKKKSKFAIPWIIAAGIECILIAISVVERSIGHTPYVLAGYAESWLQVIILIPIVVGYIFFARMSKKGYLHG